MPILSMRLPWPMEISMRRVRQIAIGCFVALLIGGCGCQIALVLGRIQEWNNEVAPFAALGARVVATGGDDMGRWAGREGVRCIYFGENVGDAELAGLARRMERFPNLDTLVLEGPNVTDAGLAHLKGLRQLKTLILHGTRVTEKGKLDLQGELPNLRDL